ncbi:MAG: hypothetical protein HKN87_12210 [Saprospiraceae bacterium]|nr:hypothetical protein [Saprospiraceae bacterium]
MLIARMCCLLGLLSMLACDRIESSNASSTLQVGYARANITPPEGCRLCGTFEEKINRGLHDSLYVRAIVFRQDSIMMAMVGCDLAKVHPTIGECLG